MTEQNRGQRITIKAIKGSAPFNHLITLLHRKLPRQVAGPEEELSGNISRGVTKRQTTVSRAFNFLSTTFWFAKSAAHKAA